MSILYIGEKMEHVCNNNYIHYKLAILKNTPSNMNSIEHVLDLLDRATRTKVLYLKILVECYSPSMT